MEEPQQEDGRGEVQVGDPRLRATSGAPGGRSFLGGRRPGLGAPADRPPRARVPRLLRGPPLGRPGGRAPALAPRGIILSGGPASVYEPGAPSLPPVVLDLGVPVLGICYGMQLLAHRWAARCSRASAPGVRPRHHWSVVDRQDALLFAGCPSAPGVDEPRRPGGHPAAGLPRPGHDTAPAPFAAMGRTTGRIRPPVPPRGGPHAPRG